MPGYMAGRGGTLAGELGGGWVDYLIVTITVQGDAAGPHHLGGWVACGGGAQ